MAHLRRAATVLVVLLLAAGIFVAGRLSARFEYAEAGKQASRPDPAKPNLPDEGEVFPSPELDAAMKRLRATANDPESVEVVEAWKPAEAHFTNAGVKADRAIYALIRSRNEAGALEVKPHLLFLLGGRLVEDQTRFMSIQHEVWRYYRATPLPPDPWGDAIKNAQTLPTLPNKTPVRP